MKIICPYCGSIAALEDAFTIYRRHGYGQIYFCKTESCDAYVGVVDGTKKPKGSLANAYLRNLRKQVRSVFDPLWFGNPLVERSEIFAAASTVLGQKSFSVGDMREEAALAFLNNKDDLIEEVLIVVQRNRLFKISKGSKNLLDVLRYLYVDSQRNIHHVLPQYPYRGHSDVFKDGIDAGLVRRIKKAVTNKVFFALTPAGCSAIGVPNN